MNLECKVAPQQEWRLMEVPLVISLLGHFDLVSCQPRSVTSPSYPISGGHVTRPGYQVTLRGA